MKDYLRATITKLLQDRPSGLLPEREDPRDHSAEDLGLFLHNIQDTDLYNGYLLNQLPWNTCGWFSRTQGASHQNGIDLSARWLVIAGYRNGKITQDGFTTLGKVNEITHKIGYVPEYMLPSNTAPFRTFKEYVTISDEKYNELLKVAMRVPEYRHIYTDTLAYKALETGHTLFVGYKWTSHNNNPARYKNILPFTGYITGGHACELSGNKGGLKMNPQTFGRGYGDDGVVWSRKFSDYGIYIEDMLPFDSRLKVFVHQYEGEMVKWSGDPACYVIQDGIKHHVLTMDMFHDVERKGHKLKYVKKDLLDAIPSGEDYKL